MHFSVTLGLEDFISDEQLERVMAATMLQSKHEAAQHEAQVQHDEEIYDILLQQSLVISTLPPVITSSPMRTEAPPPLHRRCARGFGEPNFAL